jgi:ABC-type glycerol-3-phosphate transport system substrate-binding protein
MLHKKLCVLVVLFLTVGCFFVIAGGQGKAGAEEKVAISWYSASHGEAAVVPFRDRIIAEFEAANPDIFIEKVIPPRADTWNKFVVAARAGHTPDLFEQRAAVTLVCAQEGWVQKMDELATEEFLSNFHKKLVDACRYQGSLYGIPTWGGSYATFYNTKLCRKAGLNADNAPKSWDDLLSWLKKLTVDTNGDGEIDQWGMSQVWGKTDTSTYHLYIWLWSNGANMYNDSLTKCTLDQPDAIEALKFRTDLFLDHGVIPSGPTTYEYVQSTTAFAFEKTAVTMSANWAVAKMATDNPDIKGNFVIKPNPYRKQPATFANIFMTTIGRDCEHPEQAWKFIEFLNSRDVGIAQTLETNLVSLRKDVASDPGVQASPMKQFVELLDVAGTFMIPNARFAEMESVARNMVHEVLLKQKTAEQAARDATKQIDELIKNP